MAYNLASLVQILEQILLPHHHRWILDPHKKPEIESLLEKARSLKEFFRNSSPLTGSKKECFEGLIRDATYEAEDVLESYMADQILSIREGESFMFSPPSLRKVIGEFQSLEEKIKMMLDGIQIPDKSSTPQPAESSSRNDPNRNNILVGISKDSIQLKDRLSGQQSKLEVIPIVGMGGIGKTALARNVYDDPLVIYHFDIRAWVTVSQDYDVRSILLGLLDCVVGKPNDKMLQQTTDQLGLQFYQSLCGRRYVLVLDDIWNTTVWDDIRMFFPNNGNGSRIMLTTRESSVADYAGSSNSPHHQMRLLSEDDSWNLLRERVFAQETCPLELEKIGRKIANGCRGLPLAIHVIGGLLSPRKKAQPYWVQVAKDVSSVVADKDEQFSKVLSLSYTHLPNHLKPCFLYMGAFPEDYEIRASRLIMLWVAEGFLEPITNRSPEDAAEMYLKDLVDRNLISVSEQEPNGTVRSCSVHDLLRELSVKKACEEKFLHLRLLNNTEFMPRVSLVRVRDIYGSSTEFMKLSRSFIFNSYASGVILADVVFEMRLLKVLDIFEVKFYKFPEEILQLVNLRYLAFTCHSSLPSSLSTLRNLQTIIYRLITNFFDSSTNSVIFSMPQLRHIKFKETFPNYFSSSSGESSILQENLHTLSTIILHTDSRFILHNAPQLKGLESAPNLKKLGIFSCYEVCANIDLACLRKLETLKCSTDMSPETRSFLSFVIFPPSLKKLTLRNCVIPSGFLEKIGTLPNLEVLKLLVCTFESPSLWEPAAEGDELFCQLQFLYLLNLKNLKNICADFPRLIHLVIAYCSELEEIPSGIGELPTLQIIQVHECSTYVEASARKIEEEQLELGNDGLRVLISPGDKLLMQNSRRFQHL